MRKFGVLTLLMFQMNRQAMVLITVVNMGFGLGLVIGFGYLIPGIGEETALFLVTGAATQMIVTVGLVMLPQQFSLLKSDGRLDYFLTLPISREGFLLAHVAVALVQVLPAIAFALALGAWHYDFTLHLHPAFIVVVPLSVFAVCGFGVAMALLSPSATVTNSITQMLIFYVLFFAPVLLPAEQLPEFLQWAGKLLPPTYAADAIRATTTDLDGTHLGRSLLALLGFTVISFGLSAAMMRRRA